MPINPNIALGAQPQQQPNMLGQLGQMMAIKAAQQEMEGSEGVRNALSRGAPEDPTQLLQYGKQGRATYESLLKGKKEQLESAEKRLTMTGQIAGYVRDNPTPENFMSAVGTMVQNGVLTRAQAERVIADAGTDPSKIKSYAERAASDALKEADRLTARTRIQAANIGAAPGHRQADIAGRRLSIEEQDRAEVAALMRGEAPSAAPAMAAPVGAGGVPTGVSAPTNALAPASAAAPSVNALATPTGDVYAQISAIDAQIAQLMRTGNPKATAIAQVLNSQRTQLLASAKQQYGGNLVDMQVPDPTDPKRTITIKGRPDQYGRVVPAEMGAVPLSVDASATGSTTISPSVVRAAPTAGQERQAETARLKEEGQNTVNTVLNTLSKQYQGLVNEGAITDTSKGTLANLKASASSNVVGQMVGGAVGSKAQQFRDSVAQTRPLLLNAIKNASGMSAQQLNSNVELQTYLKAATDTGLSIQANVEAMNNISKMFGLGEEFKIEPPAKKGSAPSSGGAALPKGFKLD
jgi:hypothetical protein